MNHNKKGRDKPSLLEIKNVTRHKVCHSEIINFNDLENIATHDDKGQRRNLCHLFDKTTQPLSIFKIERISCIHSYYLTHVLSFALS